MTSGQEQITTEQLTRAAAGFQSSVPPHLTSASADLGKAAAIAYTNFTAVTPMLSTAYTLATSFMQKELQQKQAEIGDIHDKLASTAATWNSAEQHSTVQR